MDTATISEAYRQSQQTLHQNPAYGMASVAMAPLVAQVIRAAGVRSLSDYGAGKKRLHGALTEQGIADLAYLPYDPAFPEYGPPQAADLVCCIDVLEHVEPECLDAVLDDLRRVTVRLGFFSIHLGPAQKFLPDGRNAHLIQQSISWWLLRLAPRFEVVQLQTHQVHGNGVWVIVKPVARSQ
ncbi:MAG: hypothetical protein ACOVQT_09555 [Rubrivivax sp.]|jgi:hypothetical protein